MSKIIDYPTKVESLPLPEDGENKKVTLVDKEGNAANIGLGDMYSVNQELMQKEPNMSNSKTREHIAKIAADIPHNHYYMLLCRELNDYSIFILNDDIAEFKAAMRDCIVNRGFCKGIDKQEDGAWEIWIQADKDSLPNAYYFFNCDQCIIPC